MAATITHGGTLPDSSAKSDFYNLIDTSTISGIVNAEISATAAIALSKLATGNTIYADTRYKVVTFSKNIADASGSQTVTGVGFTPVMAILFGSIPGTKTAFWAFIDGTTKGMYIAAPDFAASPTAGFFNQGSTDEWFNICVDSSNYTVCNGVWTWNSDGWVMNWAKVGSPTGTARIVALAIL